jgi:hypothetical protein
MLHLEDNVTDCNSALNTVTVLAIFPCIGGARAMVEPYSNTFSCIICGNAVQRYPSMLSHSRHTFCSRACYHLFRRQEAESEAKRAERFWAKVDRRSENECWLWRASLKGGGYGQFTRGGRHLGRSPIMGAHCFSYELHHGPIPPGMQVCHSCDNPPMRQPCPSFAWDMRRKSQRGWSKGAYETHIWEFASQCEINRGRYPRD